MGRFGGTDKKPFCLQLTGQCSISPATMTYIRQLVHQVILEPKQLSCCLHHCKQLVQHPLVSDNKLHQQNLRLRSFTQTTLQSSIQFWTLPRSLASVWDVHQQSLHGESLSPMETWGITMVLQWPWYHIQLSISLCSTWWQLSRTV